MHPPTPLLLRCAPPPAQRAGAGRIRLADRRAWCSRPLCGSRSHCTAQLGQWLHHSQAARVPFRVSELLPQLWTKPRVRPLHVDVLLEGLYVGLRAPFSDLRAWECELEAGSLPTDLLTPAHETGTQSLGHIVLSRSGTIEKWGFGAGHHQRAPTWFAQPHRRSRGQGRREASLIRNKL